LVGRVWTGWIWLMLGIHGGLMWTWYWTLGFQNKQEIWVAKQLLSSSWG
jgi:hypothetical protein